MNISALANDTVGTLCAEAYKQKNCVMGVILGTGTNACYIENIDKITKLQSRPKINGSGMIVNMEWGAFGETSSVLPITPADKAVDKSSLNRGKQIFEKMISGMYLGSIVKFHLLDLVERHKLSDKFHKLIIIDFESKYVSSILSDCSTGLDSISHLFSTSFQISTTLEERRIIKRVTEQIVVRAARLSAAAVVAVLRKIGKTRDAIIAIDGSVFEHVPGFKETMNTSIKQLEPISTIELTLTKDGSGVGAAIIAAVSSS